MHGNGLGQWLEVKFGKRDEALFYDDELRKDLRVTRVECGKRYEDKLEELRHLYEQYRLMMDDMAAMSERRGERLAAEAERRKRAAERRESELELFGRELAAVVIIQAIRERIDDEPEPDELTAAIETAYEESPLPQADCEDHLGAVVDAIEVSGASPAPIDEAALPDPPDELAPHEPPFDDQPLDSGPDEIDDDLL